MRALQQTTLDGPHGLQLITDADLPDAGPGEVLVRVTAAGVNYRDVLQAYGTSPGGPAAPFVAGFEAAGEIVAGPRAGERVTGVGAGTFAEYTVLSSAMPVPEGWSDAQALGLTVNWPTALAALRGLTQGQTVLIGAAAGGTGQAAVRLAKHYGATVIATASPAKHATVRASGADHILDSHRTDLPGAVRDLTGGHGADLVLESGGGPSFAAALAAARRVTGRVVVFGLPGGTASLTNEHLVYVDQVQVMGLNIGVLAQAAPQVFGEVMGELAALLAAGVLTPTDPTPYALADGAQALADLEARTTIGKLALVV
ncbi:zinc-binding dehydrogenase [Cryptosporangium sp. NPDC048952]|uniref:zinc-binding dehydrogenase n=1 Tax=Cryptosporangium sp. NPDC048952 TaxID=3363961 RepID=UPI00371A5C4E